MTYSINIRKFCYCVSLTLTLSQREEGERIKGDKFYNYYFLSGMALYSRSFALAFTKPYFA